MEVSLTDLSDENLTPRQARTRHMKLAREIMKKRHNVLRELAK